MKPPVNPLRVTRLCKTAAIRHIVCEMSQAFEPQRQSAIRAALARAAYRDDAVRLADPDLSGARWLVASPRGVFAVGTDAARLALHGWFFGICRHGDALFLFENCGRRDRKAGLGRLIRLRIARQRLADPQVLAKGLDANCHQVRVIDGLVCVVDTADQSILRFTMDGAPVGRHQLFPAAAPGDSSGAYRHINSVARLGGRLAVLLHNGKIQPERPSEIAWLDDDWRVTGREVLVGQSCHDLVEAADGAIWYSASMSGEIAALDGRRVKISDRLMTRALALAEDGIAVGISTFGPRQLRDSMGGGLVMLDPQFRQIGQIALDGPPTDIVQL